jgi:hypothetical protein
VTRYEIDGERGEFEESFALRAWGPDEIRLLLARAGFGDVQFYGGYQLEPFDCWPSDLLVVVMR